MSIVEKKRTDLSTDLVTPTVIEVSNNPRNFIDTYTDEIDKLTKQLDKLKDAHVKNAKLFESCNNLKTRNKEIKRQLNDVTRIHNKYKEILAELNPTFICSQIQKPLSLFSCNDTCLRKYCDDNYNCKQRLSQVKVLFNLK